MTARDDLAKLVFITDNSGAANPVSEWEWGMADTEYAYAIADGLLAAGYRKPCAIATADELNALYEGSVVLDSSGDVDQKRDGLWCGYEMAPIGSGKLAKIAAPFTVIHEGSKAT